MFGFGVVLVPRSVRHRRPADRGFGWRSIFLMPVPFCVVAIAMAMRHLSRRGAAASRRTFDWMGMTCSPQRWSRCSVPVVGIARAGHRGPSRRARGLTLALGAAFIAWEYRARRCW
jgi:hypothetical protein